MELIELGACFLGGGAGPMLLWYVWIRLVDGAWHKLDDIAKQLRMPGNAVSWAAKFLSDHGLAEMGREGQIRLHRTSPRFEEVVKSLPEPVEPGTQAFS